MGRKNHSLFKITLQRFKKNALGMISLSIIILISFIALSSYLYIPDSTPNANRMSLPLANKKPGFSVEIVKLKKTIPYTAKNFFNRIAFGDDDDFEFTPINSYNIFEDYIEINQFIYKAEGTTIIEKIELTDLYNQVDLEKNVEKWVFFLGTDKYGRDLLSRMFIGARISLSVGFIAVFISLMIGIPLGAIAGFYKGKVDDIILWLINVVWSIPTLLLVIAITLAIGKGFWQIFIAVGMTMWVEVARIVRGEVLNVREEEYVKSALALGYSKIRILFVHILPNALNPVIIISAANFAAAILIEAGLSFLGIGAQPPIPSWGNIIKDHYAYILVDKAYLALIPGFAIMLLVLAFMLMGNALRDSMDVKSIK